VGAFAGLPLGKAIEAFRKVSEEKLGDDHLTVYERR
jgi:hypothetical protein